MILEKVFGASWKTSLAGVLGILVSIGLGAKLLIAGNVNFNDPAWLAVGTGLTNAFGLLNARDKKITSEQEGVTPGPVETKR